MQMRISGLILVVGALVGKNALAASIGKAKYGVVDMQQVILSVDEGKEARGVLEKEIRAKEDEFGKKKAELDKMNEEWKSQSAVLSEAAKTQKQQEFQEKFMGLRNAEQEFQGDIKKKEQKATQKIAMKVAGMVERMAHDKGLEIVFESNSSGLLYLDSPVDLTKEVITAYNKNKGSTTAKDDSKKEDSSDVKKK